jgi:hypothetical protein
LLYRSLLRSLCFGHFRFDFFLFLGFACDRDFLFLLLVVLNSKNVTTKVIISAERIVFFLMFLGKRGLLGNDDSLVAPVSVVETTLIRISLIVVGIFVVVDLSLDDLFHLLHDSLDELFGSLAQS